MSVKVHEGFCIDSFQDRLLFSDDFLGDSLRDLWTATGTGTAAVVDQQTGGIVRLTTGAVSGNQMDLDWGTIHTLHIDKQVTVETRIKLSSTSNIAGSWGVRLDFNFNNFVGFNPQANWEIYCVDDGATTFEDSGIAVTTNYVILRIECFPAGEVHFYIDGVEAANSPITTNIPNDAGDYLEPLIRIRTSTNAAKSVDVDYVVIRQEI